MNKKRFDISAATLHILAMAFMLCDHLWATLLPAQEWMTCVGRIAFPIFAFMAVEGYFHTHNFKKYAQRMLLFAVLSELPFDLMYGGTWFYPVHQNVIWTLLLGLLGIRAMEAVREKKKTWLYVLTCAAVCVFGYGQVLALYWINVNLMGGLLYPISIFGFNFELCQQGLALLALIPIWLYRGRQGYHSKPFQYACYAFYPVHILILGLIQRAL